MEEHPGLRAWLEVHAGGLEAVMLDIDGVLLLSGRAVPGSPELVAMLRARGLPPTLMTNDSQHSPAEKRAELRGGGLEFLEDEITSCGHALPELAERYVLRGRPALVLGCLGSPSYVEEAGIEAIHEAARVPECRAVIVGERYFDWEPLLNAVLNRLLSDPAVPLIVPNPDLLFPRAGGRVQMAPGAVGRLMQLLLAARGAALEPVWLGKPHPPIFRTAHRRLEARLGRPVEPGRVLMVGDSLSGDVAGGAAFGYRTALVLTGLTRRPMLEGAEILPDLLFEAL